MIENANEIKRLFNKNSDHLILYILIIKVEKIKK